jgi:acetyl-CoA carboxylase biotin carboxylase subunit
VIRRVLIANRGEIAVRVIRACKDLDIKTVAVYSEADKKSMHVELADTAVCIGPPPGKRSYLDMPSVVAAALGTHADAIHPGYGFLAENAEFAALCASQGVTFIGPTPDAIRSVGDKIIARETVAKAGVPVVGGTKDAISDPKEAAEIAAQIGMPVLLKARGGGGGRGMRVVQSVDEVASSFLDASREAEAAFGDGGMYMERYLDAVKHIEIQVLADKHGTFVALGERDCSTQRRHQKLIEEAPSPGLDPTVREQMCKAAIDAARSVAYLGAGTVEFLYSPKTREFFFIEMNARIQVEHPVTEMVTGVDIVKEQLVVASGGKLSISGNVPLHGHAIECRINAEDPTKNFFPSPGVVTRYVAPSGPGVRVDSHCYEGYTFPPNYDSLLAKLIVHGKDREESRTRMLRALSDYVIEGIKTTIPFHLAMLEHPEFRAGNVTTQFVGTQVIM